MHNEERPEAVILYIGAAFVIIMFAIVIISLKGAL